MLEPEYPNIKAISAFLICGLFYIDNVVQYAIVFKVPYGGDLMTAQANVVAEIDIEFAHRLAKFVGNYGEAGETLNRQGFRIVLPLPEKSIDVISVLSQDGLLMAIFLSGDVPNEDNTDTFRSEKVLIKWDKRISIEDIETAMKLRMN